jgi:hypothetical protein
MAGFVFFIDRLKTEMGLAHDSVDNLN